MRQSESNANRELANHRYLAESIRGVRYVRRPKAQPKGFSGHHVLAGLVFIAALMGIVRMVI